MSANQELVDRVIEVTGSSQAEAVHLLGACANDVEAAVALFFEHGAPIDPVPVVDVEEENVRAPIAPRREQLIGPEDDNFQAPAAASTAPLSTSSRLPRAAPRVKVCPFRDFAREGQLMEEQLQAATSVGGFGPPHINRVNNSSTDVSANVSEISSPQPPSSSRRRRPRTAGMVNAEAAANEVKSSSSSSSRLGDLFRPPTDIAYVGTFQTARIRANELKQWLLVNVQSDNFDSQVLNRDVWSDKEVRKLLRRRFMLWQVDTDTAEGRRFVTFYHCNVVPYICVIDPRTGEEVLKFTQTNKQDKLLPDLKKFLREHKDFCKEIGDDCPTTSKRSSEIISIDYDGDCEDSSADCSNKRAKVVELTEEEQIAMAIRNSMKENGVKNAAASDDEEGGGSDLASVEEFCEDDAKNGFEKTSFEKHLGSAKNELTMLKLRLLNDKGDDTTVELRWPSDTKLKALRAYIAQHYPNILKKGYKLICAFPRKTLEAEHDEKTLKELSLHPSANLHVTLDD